MPVALDAFAPITPSPDELRRPTPPTESAAIPDTSPWAAVAARLHYATAGEFEILTEIGRGGMAAVYLARDLALNRRVAIKVMAPGLLHDVRMIERFRQEAMTVGRLEHANIVAIYTVRQFDDLHFFVMQFVPGRSLEEVLRQVGALPVPVVRAWVYQVGSALAYAHRAGVIHRDVKPGNILLKADGDAMVTDFGIAKAAESTTRTQTGMVVGTPVYMSPEQCDAKELSGASDQYSLGVVAYEMLAGRRPFSGSTLALMRSHTELAPPPLRDGGTDVPLSVEAAVMRMLAKRPEERFPTLSEALAALGAAPLAPEDPLRATLHDLADASRRLADMGDVLRTPVSPVPRSRERAPESVTPRTPIPASAATVVAIAPPPSELEPGSVGVLRATVRNGSGQAVQQADLEWTSSDPRVVDIDAVTGALTAMAPGTAIVTASVGEARDAIDVVVGDPRVATVSISGLSPSMHVGDRATTSVTVTSRFGVPISRPVDWAVDDPAVATVEVDNASSDRTSATIRAISAGPVEVTASCDGVVGRVSVRVDLAMMVAGKPAPVAGAADNPLVSNSTAADKLAPTASALFTPAPPTSPISPADTQDAESVVADTPTPERSPRPVPRRDRGRSQRRQAWAIAVLGVAVISTWLALRSRSTSVPTDPLVDRGVAPVDSGVAKVDRPDTTTKSVSPEPLPVPKPVAALIKLNPPLPPPLAPGGRLELSVMVLDEAGKPLDSARVDWTSSNTRVATVDRNGVVSGVDSGQARIGARHGSVVSTVIVTVVRPSAPRATIATIEIQDVRLLTVGESVRAIATARDGAGVALPDASIEWRSSNPGIVSIISGGILSASAPGSATIYASAGGRVAERVVTVRSVEVGARPDSSGSKGGSAPRETDRAVISTPGKVMARRVYAGGNLSCAIREAGTLACWGRGTGLTSFTESFSQVSIGAEHACGVVGGTVMCWGSNDQGQLGDGSTSARARPTAVDGTVRFSVVVAGGSHSCALDQSGHAFCWGRNAEGQLGTGDKERRQQPTPVDDKLVFRTIAAGAKHTCAITTENVAYCWGDGFGSAVGVGGRREFFPLPMRVDTKQRFTAIAAGDNFSCGLATTGRAYCWGENRSGQLGDGSRSERGTPSEVRGAQGLTQLAVGRYHACALAAEGVVLCWGENAQGQLGNGTRTTRPTPAAIDSDQRFTSVSLGASHSCAVATSGEVLCWGANAKAQLGPQAATVETSPAGVRLAVP